MRCSKNTPACEAITVFGVRWCCLSYERVESAGAGEFSTRRNCAVGLSVQRRGLGRTLTRFCDAHRYACDPPDDGDVTRVADPPGMSTGMRSRNQNQLAAIQFTPTADVAIAKLKEEDRTVKVVMPIYGRDGSLPGIDLDERKRAEPLELSKLPQRRWTNKKRS